MRKAFHKNLRIRTFAMVMLLNFLVIFLISIFFQQRSLSFFEREFAATLYEQAFVNEMNAFAKAIQAYDNALEIDENFEPATLAKARCQAKQAGTKQ